MLVLLKHLLELPGLDTMQVPIDTANLEKTLAFTVEDGEVIKHTHLTAAYGIQLLKKQVDKINIMPEPGLLADILVQLRERHPVDYQTPTGIYSLRELATLTMQFEEMKITATR
jgi:hypothetical protein